MPAGGENPTLSTDSRKKIFVFLIAQGKRACKNAGNCETVKRILRAHGYPPDKQEQATLTVLAQAELLCKDWIV
jgi:hypothetical protein